MKKIFFMILSFVCVLSSCQESEKTIDHFRFVNFIVNSQKQDLQFFWKKNDSTNYDNFLTLKTELKKKNKDVIFAVNGGMFKKDFSPQGLYIENGITLVKTDTLKNNYGNFYLEPNGVFYLNDQGIPSICQTADLKINERIKYATQSGPMLLVEEKINTKFNKESENIQIRNGVGILPNGDLLFAMSKRKINFYDFANYFKINGCKNALYLDGFVSRTYLPSENWEQIDGRFGVIIAVIKSNN